jgi:RNA polymerase sigma factor (sigma-70 family)
MSLAMAPRQSSSVLERTAGRHDTKQECAATSLKEVTQARADWEHLYRRAFPEVYRAVLAVVLDPDIALDSVQDAFEIGLRNPPTSETNLSGWLFRVAIRRAMRVRLRRPPRQIPAALRNDLDRALDRIETKRLLEMLTPRQRSIVVAHYFLGLRQEEIASLLGLRRGTVGATISHALARMREENSNG